MLSTQGAGPDRGHCRGCGVNLDVSPGERRLAAPGGPARGPAPRGRGCSLGSVARVEKRCPTARHPRGTHAVPAGWGGARPGGSSSPPASGTFQPRQTRGCHRTWVPSRGGEATGDPGRRFGIRGGERGLVRVALLLTKTKVVIFCRISPRRVTAQVQRTPGGGVFATRPRHPAVSGLRPLFSLASCPFVPSCGQRLPLTRDLPSSSPSAAGQA